MHVVSIVCDFVIAHLYLFFVIIIINFNILMISNIAIIFIYSNYIITIDILSYAREGIQRKQS